MRTVTPCQVWEIDRQAFLKGIDAIPALRSKIYSTITGRFQSLSHRFSEILKHIPYGIIKIDLDGKITAEFSSRCIDYLGITQLAGKKLGELFFAGNMVLSEKWNHAIESLAADTGPSFDTKLNLLPEEVTYLHPDRSSRIFELFYHITEDEHGQVTGLDIGINDVTQNRQYQSELSSFQNMMTNLEKLLILIEAETGLIIQETFSHSQLGQMHFPAWINLKGKNIMDTILSRQDKDQLDHFRRWLRMLGDQFVLKTISTEDLIELSPRFAFETVLGNVMELSFTLNPFKTNTYTEVLGKFEFLEKEPEPQEFQYSTMELMEEAMAAEAEHSSGLMEALNEMQISLEIAQSHMTTPNDLAINHRRIAGMIHSVKGLGQSFGLNTIASASHELEEVLAETLKSGQKPNAISLVLTSFKSLLSLIVVSKSLCDADETKDLGKCRSREPEIRIPLTRFRQIKQELDKVLDFENTGTLQNGQSTVLMKLKDEIFSLEMTKLETVFPRLQRIITDTARLLNKQVEFKIIEKTPVLMNLQTRHLLSTCLIQLVKNAVCHGIEAPGDRRSLGKPEEALIELVIVKNDGRLIVSVQDDGKGVNIEKTVNRAIQLNLLDPLTAEQMRQENRQGDILVLLFEPGFSTAGSVSLISGRGVGMSMIKTEMESLGGTVSIESQENKGTRVNLGIPITPDEIKVLRKEADF